MKKLLFLIWIQLFWMTGFSQSLPNIHIQRTNLVVRWKAPKHPWPKVVGIYHVVPTTFSPTVISNLMVLGSFTEKDKRDYGDVVIFGKPYSTPHLRISFVDGEIEYDGDRPHYSETNLAKDVPERKQLFHLTTNFLPELGISLSEIARQKNGKPQINYDASMSGFPAGGTNGDFIFLERGISFSRDLNGGRFFSDGGCYIDFGEHGKIFNIALSWPSLKCDELYSAATPEQIIQRIRDGKALQRHLISLEGTETMLDWSTVKSLTVTNAEVLYYRGDSFVAREFAPQPILPSLVYPHAELSGTVDTGTAKVHIEIVCPVIDETKPLKTK